MFLEESVALCMRMPSCLCSLWGTLASCLLSRCLNWKTCTSSLGGVTGLPKSQQSPGDSDLYVELKLHWIFKSFSLLGSGYLCSPLRIKAACVSMPGTKYVLSKYLSNKWIDGFNHSQQAFNTHKRRHDLHHSIQQPSIQLVNSYWVLSKQQTTTLYAGDKWVGKGALNLYFIG